MKEENNILDHLKPRKVTTPDADYFAKMAEQVLAEQKRTKIVPLYKKPVFWITSAAAVIAVIFFINLDAPVTHENALLALDELSHEEVYTYIDNNIEDFDADMIAEVLSAENIEIVEPNVHSEEPSVEQPIEELEKISTDEILHYLLEQEIDLEDEGDELFIDL